MSSLGPPAHSARPLLDRRTVSTPGAPLGTPGKGPTYPGRVGPRHPHHGGGGSTTSGAHARAPRARHSPSASGGRRAAAISSCDRRPFIATSAPAGATSGIDHPSRRSRGATARDGDHVERRASRAGPRHARGPPRRGSSPSSATTSSRKVVRRSSGSTSVTARSGRAIASTRPGRPAPEPMSHTEAPSGGSARPARRAVEQVPVPQPRRLARPDQAADDAVGRQQLGVPLGQRAAGRTRNTLPRPTRRGAEGCFT